MIKNLKKILIANRGEIACRIIRTCRRMGISTVAIYSEADHTLRHKELADEAYCIGAAPPAESYLNQQKIIEVALNAKCDAIHPGYGFLSENATFAKEVTHKGLTFIGPSPESIALMGDKITAKEAADKAKAPLIPGTKQAVESLEKALEEAMRIGFPLLIKASAGGGGKGMRLAHNSKEFKDIYQSTKREAEKSFGDGRVFLEKYLESPRHIEVQVLGDQHGNIIHLGERECSLQRRYQKIVEEAPSPSLPKNVRTKLHLEAVNLAKQIGYFSAGTIEFIVDKKNNFYFLEMNTRLQVEHPVTEEITGLDLVEEMILVAKGKKLRYTQKDISFKGHSIESRIYAEDAEAGFLPSTGTLNCYTPSYKIARVETGLEEGDFISPFYDPMIAKVITHAPNREKARQLHIKALENFYIDGIKNNISFLLKLLKDKNVIEHKFSTHYVEKNIGHLLKSEKIPPETFTLLSLITAYLESIFSPESSWNILFENKQLTVEKKENAVFKIKNKKYKIDVLENEKFLRVEIDKKTYTLYYLQDTHTYTFLWPEKNIFSETVHAYPAHVSKFLSRLSKCDVEDQAQTLVSPMPGRVIDVFITENQKIKAGERLVTVETMKMENILFAEKDQSVEKILVKQGESVEIDQPLVVFKNS